MTGISTRFFLIDDRDEILGLSLAQFEQMRADPQRHRVTQWAGKHIGMAEVNVELRDRRPVRVLRTAFGGLIFDSDGSLDVALYAAEVADHFRNALSLSGRPLRPRESWSPAPALESRLYRVALGKDKCRRVKFDSNHSQ